MKIAQRTVIADAFDHRTMSQRATHQQDCAARAAFWDWHRVCAAPLRKLAMVQRTRGCRALLINSITAIATGASLRSLSFNKAEGAGSQHTLREAGVWVNEPASMRTRGCDGRDSSREGRGESSERWTKRAGETRSRERKARRGTALEKWGRNTVIC